MVDQGFLLVNIMAMLVYQLNHHKPTYMLFKQFSSVEKLQREENLCYKNKEGLPTTLKLGNKYNYTVFLI